MPSRWSCHECGVPDPKMFFVHDFLWLGAGYKHLDLICQPCFEKRIGRKLVMEDLTLCALNFMCVPEFNTEDNYRKFYTEGGMDYDKEKAAYFERCKQLGLKPNWSTSESSQTQSSGQSVD